MPMPESFSKEWVRFVRLVEKYSAAANWRLKVPDPRCVKALTRWGSGTFCFVNFMGIRTGIVQNIANIRGSIIKNG
jgi:hypothetical protein